MTKLVDIGGDTLVDPSEVAAVINGHDGVSQRWQVILKNSGVRLSAGKELSLAEVVERVTNPANHYDPSFMSHGPTPAYAVPGER